MAKLKRVAESTNSITEGIVNTLLIDGHSASRINTMGIYVEHLHGYNKGDYRPSGSRNGFSDVLACLKPMGRGLAIEVKFNGDTQREAQEVFQKEWEAAGGIYLIVKTWMDWQMWYNDAKQKNYML